MSEVVTNIIIIITNYKQNNCIINYFSDILTSWMDMASRCFLPFGLKDGKAEELVSSAQSYSNLDLPSWTLNQDEQLCQLISKNSKLQVKDLIESLKVSSVVCNFYCAFSCFVSFNVF